MRIIFQFGYSAGLQIILLLCCTIITINSISNEYVKRPCSLSAYKIGRQTSGLQDIFDAEEFSASSIRGSSINMLTDAIHYIKQLNATATTALQELATLHPQYSGCAWLEVDTIDRAGLGHSFSSFVNYLKLAVSNNLTYHASFYMSANQHENTCDLNETAHFFGLHSVFFWSRSPPSNAIRVHIGQGNRGCNASSITHIVNEYRRIHGPFSCLNTNHVVFMCHNAAEPFSTRVTNSAVGALLATRASFLAGYKHHKNSHIYPSFYTTLKKDKSVLKIAVHIRRGDILRSKRVDKEHRLVSYNIYSNIITTLLEQRNSNSFTANRSISIFILCEGSPDQHTVVDYDEKHVKIQRTINVQNDLLSVCNLNNNCNVEVAWDADLFQSFVIMCDSEVLITSTSGFAWTAATLCEPPLTVSFPWGNTYDGLRNVVAVKSIGPLWSHHSEALLPNISSAWTQMVDILSNR